ncbi:MAG TPA: extracellular solute-binding protein [Chloroflexota bacterium]|nr:extracellular solute-binding protein [Chloroflexota bacterium]
MLRHTRRAVLATAPIGAAALAACGAQATESGPAPAAGPVRLLHWMHQNPARNAAVDELIAAYKQKHPNVEIVFETLPQATYWEKLTPALVADAGPDSFQLPMGLTQLYFGRGQLATLDGPTAARVNDEFLPWTLDRLRRANQIFGIPVDTQTTVLYCHDNLFAQSGLDVTKAPANWPALEQWARALHKTSGAEIQQLGINPANPQVGCELVLQQKLQPTPMIDPRTNKVNWDRPEALEAFEWLTTLTRQYGDPAFRDRDIWTSKVGMVAGLPVLRGQIAQRAPDLKYTIHHFPPPAGKPAMTAASHWAWVVNKQSKVQPDAWRWITFSTSEESQGTWYRVAGDLPTRKKIVNDASWRKTRNDEVVMESLKQSKPRSWIGWDEWQAVYQGAVNRVVGGQQSARQSLAQAAIEANEAIQRNLPPR